MWYYEHEGKPAGPESQEKMESLLRDGVIRPETLVWQEGMPDWVQARRVFQIKEKEEAQSEQAPAPQRVDMLDVGDCLQEARQTFKVHWGVLVVGWLIACVVIPALISAPFTIADLMLGVPWKGQPPEMTPMRAAINGASFLMGLVINTPLQAGFFLMALQALRSQPDLAVIFQPFRACWLRLIGAILAVWVLTVGILAVPIGGTIWAVISEQWVVAVVLGVIAVAFMIYLSLCFLFVMPLVADAGRGPLRAVGDSVRLVQSNLLMLFALAVVCLAINMLGLLCFCVGLLVTAPFTTVVLMTAYRRLVYNLN